MDEVDFGGGDLHPNIAGICMEAGITRTIDSRSTVPAGSGISLIIIFHFISKKNKE
jgi:hypothetical protein